MPAPVAGRGDPLRREPELGLFSRRGLKIKRKSEMAQLRTVRPATERDTMVGQYTHIDAHTHMRLSELEKSGSPHRELARPLICEDIN